MNYENRYIQSRNIRPKNTKQITITLHRFHLFYVWWKTKKDFIIWHWNYILNAKCFESDEHKMFPKSSQNLNWTVNWPLLVALTYADDRLFKPDVPSSPPSIWSTRDNETIVRNSSVIFISSFAEHSRTLAL